MTEVIEFSPELSLICLNPPIPGFHHFLSSYVLKSEQIALIDVGTATTLEDLFSGLQQLKISPESVDYVLITHIHLDHVGGLGGAVKRLPNAKVILHEKGKPHMVNPGKLWEGSKAVLKELSLAYGEPEPVPQDRLIVAREGMVIDLGRMQLEALATPGHAFHHLSYLNRKENILFAGEVGGVYCPEVDLLRPATPIPYNLEQNLKSLDKLIEIGPGEIHYSHFGYAQDAVGQLKRHKRQLLLWGKIIADKLNDKADWQRIFDEIQAQDKTLAGIHNLPEDKKNRELNFIKNAINGLIDYFNHNGTATVA